MFFPFMRSTAALLLAAVALAMPGSAFADMAKIRQSGSLKVAVYKDMAPFSSEAGGIAPDLRLLDRDCMTQKVEAKKKMCFKDNDDYFATSVRKGKVRNGAVYMPPFDGILNQEAVWSIKAYLETRREMK